MQPVTSSCDFIYFCKSLSKFAAQRSQRSYRFCIAQWIVPENQLFQPLGWQNS